LRSTMQMIKTFCGEDYHDYAFVQDAVAVS
jgi:hypothetical protein